MGSGCCLRLSECCQGVLIDAQFSSNLNSNAGGEAGNKTFWNTLWFLFSCLRHLQVIGVMSLPRTEKQSICHSYCWRSCSFLKILTIRLKGFGTTGIHFLVRKKDHARFCLDNLPQAARAGKCQTYDPSSCWCAASCANCNLQWLQIKNLFW